MAKLEIHLLGRFAVVSGTGPIELKDRPAQLLAYLALTGGRTIPRTRAAGALWPDLPEERARANLSTVAWRLRGALESHGHPAGVLVATATSVGLNKDLCEVDVEQFRRGVLRSGQTEAGHGWFLACFSYPNCRYTIPTEFLLTLLARVTPNPRSRPEGGDELPKPACVAEGGVRRAMRRCQSASRHLTASFIESFSDSC